VLVLIPVLVLIAVHELRKRKLRSRA